METNKEQVVALLKEKGYSAAAIAGIVKKINLRLSTVFQIVIFKPVIIVIF